MADSGYLVILPKIEIFDDSQTKVREIGAYCMPISLVNPIQGIRSPEKMIERHPSPPLFKRDGEKGHNHSRNFSRGRREEDMKTTAKYKDNRLQLNIRSENQVPKDTHTFSRYEISKNHNHWDDRMLDDAHYSPNAFKHLRSLNYYLTPDMISPERPTQDLHKNTRKDQKEEFSKTKPDDFSFDIYSQKINGVSPLDHIERHLLLDDSLFMTSNGGSSEHRDHVEINELDKNKIRWYKDREDRRPMYDDREKNYSPPYRNNKVLKRISESPLTSPNTTHADRKKSSENNRYERFRQERGLINDAVESETKHRPYKKDKPSHLITFEHPQSSIESYPGSLLAHSESKK